MQSCVLTDNAWHSLVYRDTKPMNAGFDVRGDIKVSDIFTTK